MFAKVHVIPLSRRKHGFESRWACQRNQSLRYAPGAHFPNVRRIYGKPARGRWRTNAAFAIVGGVAPGDDPDWILLPTAAAIVMAGRRVDVGAAKLTLRDAMADQRVHIRLVQNIDLCRI